LEPSARIITRSIATLSWIDPITKLPEVDKLGDPGDSVSRYDIIGRDGYRFANFLEVWIKVWNGVILDHGVTDASGIYRTPSYLKIPSEEFPTHRRVDADSWRVKYAQLVGARTQSPEVIAEQIGFALSLGTIGAPIAREVIEQTSVCFPPIWTELELTVYGDGWFEGKLLRHSLFPSLCFYRQELIIRTAEGRELPYDPALMSVRQPPPVALGHGPIDLNALKNGSRHLVFIDSRELPGARFSDTDSGYYGKVSSYNGVPKYEKWLSEGWGALRDPPDAGPGRVRGNPWSIPSPKGWGSGRPMRTPGMVPTD
jgi:hypothetical protein